MRDLIFIAILLLICLPPLRAQDVRSTQWPITVPTLTARLQAQPEMTRFWLVPQTAPQPSKRKWFDWKYALMAGFVIGGSVADVESTYAAIGRGAQEANPLMRWAINRGRPPSYGFKMALNLPSLWAMKRLKQQGVKKWWLPGLVSGGMQYGFAVHNWRVK